MTGTAKRDFLYIVASDFADSVAADVVVSGQPAIEKCEI